MEALVQYLFESSLILGLLTIFYRLVLHNERIFRFNRFYLLLSLFLASVVPFIHLSKPIGIDQQSEGFSYLLGSIDVYSTQIQETVVPKIVQIQLFNWLYVFGVILLVIRLFYGFVQLGGLSKKANWSKVNGYRVANLPGRFNPFSFFNIIFVNQSLYSDDDLDKIMDHEMAHIQFKHSLDVIIIECLLIIQWFNPFAWIIQRLLKELHEFQADKEVLRKGTSVGQYKMLLLFQASGARLLPVNNFNQSITKKRFNMMTNNSLKKYGVLKAVMALMVVSTVTFFFACDNEYSEEEGVNDVELKGAETSLSDEIAYNVVEKMPEYPGGEMELRKFIAQNVKYPSEAQELGVQGKVYVTFIVGKDGVVKDIKVARGIHESIDNEAIRVVGLMPKWEPGMQRGEYVNVNFTIPINFVLQGDDEDISVSGVNKHPLVIMDGNEISYAEMQKIDPEMIEVINIVKDSVAIAKFGEKGINGVIEVKTKYADSNKNAVHVVACK